MVRFGWIALQLIVISTASCAKDWTLCWLEKIDLSKNDITNADGLARCTGVKWLNLSNNRLESMQFVSKMTRLNVLNLGYNAIEDASPVQNLQSLKALILNNNKIGEIDGLERMKFLNTLVLSHNELTEFNCSSLSVLVKLQLAHNRLTGFPNVKFMLELKNLLLNDNMIKDIPYECIGNNKLELVDLGKNRLKKFRNIEALSVVTSIANLNLFGNPLCDQLDYTGKMVSLFPRMKTFDAKPVYKHLSKSPTTSVVSSKMTSSDEESPSLHKTQCGNVDTKSATKRKLYENEHDSNEDRTNDDDSTASLKRQRKKKKKMELEEKTLVEDATETTHKQTKKQVEVDVSTTDSTDLSTQIKKKLKKKKNHNAGPVEADSADPMSLGGSSEAAEPSHEASTLKTAGKQTLNVQLPKRRANEGMSATKNSKKSGVLNIVESRNKCRQKPQAINLDDYFKDNIGLGLG